MAPRDQRKAAVKKLTNTYKETTKKFTEHRIPAAVIWFNYETGKLEVDGHKPVADFLEDHLDEIMQKPNFNIFTEEELQQAQEYAPPIKPLNEMTTLQLKKYAVGLMQHLLGKRNKFNNQENKPSWWPASEPWQNLQTGGAERYKKVISAYFQAERGIDLMVNSNLREVGTQANLPPATQSEASGHLDNSNISSDIPDSPMGMSTQTLESDIMAEPVPCETASPECSGSFPWVRSDTIPQAVAAPYSSNTIASIPANPPTQNVVPWTPVPTPRISRPKRKAPEPTTRITRRNSRQNSPSTPESQNHQSTATGSEGQLQGLQLYIERVRQQEDKQRKKRKV